MRAVDRVVDTVSAALQRNGETTKMVERWYKEMPREEEMLPKDKYTIFDKKEKKYRKGIHSKSPAIDHLFGITSDGLWHWRLTHVLSRAAEMDTSQPASEPPWFLIRCYG